ncbi:MAG: transcriptional repressor [Halothiobacillaceae bacterium]|jgi:Fur family zinc uptake transcriptional regulator|nr:transcriptional repressor [Halothiobacillaceae bacterium]
MTAHDHANCIDRALAEAERICSQRGARLTPLRRQVLEEIWRNHEAVKAYDLIHRLSGSEHTTKPPTVYRALDFLLEHGLIHRIESLNAYVGCDHPEAHHDPVLFLCERCGDVREARHAGLIAILDEMAATQGFTIAHRTLELRGRCTRCQSPDDKDHARPPADLP